MALIAESRTANILKSLNVYFYDNLVVAASLEVHFPDQPGLFTPSGARWVRLDYLLGTSRQYMGAVAGSSKGSLVRGIINCNCCELVAKRTDLYALYALRDTVYRYIQEGTSIIVQDYDTVGTPVAGYLVVHDIAEARVQDGLGSTENGITITNLSATVEYVEAYT